MPDVSSRKNPQFYRYINRNEYQFINMKNLMILGVAFGVAMIPAQIVYAKTPFH